MKQYDVIVVGTGGANIVVDAAQRKGLRIAQIEKEIADGIIKTINPKQLLMNIAMMKITLTIFGLNIVRKISTLYYPY